MLGAGEPPKGAEKVTVWPGTAVTSLGSPIENTALSSATGSVAAEPETLVNWARTDRAVFDEVHLNYRDCAVMSTGPFAIDELCVGAVSEPWLAHVWPPSLEICHCTSGAGRPLPAAK